MTSARTLLGPLTTTWTAPPVCSYYMGLGQTNPVQYLGQTCNSASNIHDWTDCWPPRATALPDPGVFLGWGLYSPGISCPAGFSTIAKATAGGSTDANWGVEYSLTGSETAIACCPTGFTVSFISVSSTYGQTCVLTATSTTYPTVQCVNGQYTGFGDVTLTGDQKNTIYAPLFQLNYQPSDLPAVIATTSSSTRISSSATPTSTSSSSSSVPTPSSSSFSSSGSAPQSSSSSSIATSTSSSSSPISTASDTPVADGSTSSSSLSRGAIAGIAVAAALIGLLVLVALLFFIRRRKRKAPRDLPPTDPKKVPVAADAELGGGDIGELEGNHKPSEMSSTPFPRDNTQPPGAGTKFRQSAGFPYTEDDLRRPNPVFELEGDNGSNPALSQATSRHGSGVEDDVSSLGSVAPGSPATRTRGEGNASPRVGDASLLSPLTPTRRSADGTRL